VECCCPQDGAPRPNSSAVNARRVDRVCTRTSGAGSAVHENPSHRRVAAFSKAGKIVNGKDLAADDAAFWKKQCAKKPDDQVKKDTECLDEAKTKDDVGKCMK
jgi:hypothetical protein